MSMKHNTPSWTVVARVGLAMTVLAAGAAGISAWAQKDTAAARPVSSNVTAPLGQVGPQPMVTAEPHRPAPPIEGATSRDPLVRGEYLARMGDCVACHTVKGGKPFAGGAPFASPIGTMYSSNITPDKEHGIGSYSFEDFDQAVRHGVDKKKGSLYPAMPYPSYARVSDQDMKDMYAYFMQKVQPVASDPPKNGITWPLSMRWPMGLWRAMFAPNPAKVQVQAAAVAPTADPKVRGAYLVEGLGHCGACHTPRSVTMAEKALTDADPLFLSGSDQPMDGWTAKSLRGDASGLASWSAADIVALLKTGRNDHTAVFGGMSEVIEHSTQYVSDSDLQAIAAYLKSLGPGKDGSGNAATAFAANPDTANALWRGDTRQRGSALYLDNCAACHRSDGKGYSQVFPALAGNSAVLASDPQNVIAIVLQGHTVPPTTTRPSTFTMPAFAWRLTDDQVADVSTFVRGSWGNNAQAVTPAQVAKVRKPLGEQARPVSERAAAK